MASAPVWSPARANSIELSKLMELSVTCRDLIGLDLLSKSDPLVVVSIQPFGEKRWREIARTEAITNSHNPDFATKINVQYHFEEQQNFRFDVYDVDSDSPDLSRHDFLGFVEISLGQIVSTGIVKKALNHPTDHSMRGNIIIIAEELSSSKDEIELQFRGRNLDSKSFWSTDPFFIIYKSNENGDYNNVYKSEKVRNTLNPTWKPFRKPVRTLCNSDYDRNLRISLFDHRNSGDHVLIGHVHTTLNELKQKTTSVDLPVIHPEKQKRKAGYTNSGQLTLANFALKPIYSFLDYLRGGTEIHCTIAIDFTASNGSPTSPDSLHYMGPMPTLYERALSAVGEILQDYDTDKQIPVLGFGAKIPPQGAISHEFFVNMHPSNPYCFGVNGVVAAYRACLPQIQLCGPTNFAPCLNHVVKFATQFQDGSHYFILLILTDGVITDMEQTKEAIVSASVLPLSIIIVGIGNADFGAMEELDSDTVRLTTSRGRQAARDIVQFVPFNKYLTGGLDPSIARMKLAQEVLAEIPAQFLGYMKTHNIEPKPAKFNAQNLPPDPENL